MENLKKKPPIYAWKGEILNHFKIFCWNYNLSWKEFKIWREFAKCAHEHLFSSFSSLLFLEPIDASTKADPLCIGWRQINFRRWITTNASYRESKCSRTCNRLRCGCSWQAVHWWQVPSGGCMLALSHKSYLFNSSCSKW